MSTKMKIIIVIFGVVAFLFFVQYMISMVGTEKKKEKYWNDVQESFEEEPNEKVKDEAKDEKKKTDDKPNEAPKDKAQANEAPKEKKEDPKADQTLRIKILDAIDAAFDAIPGAKEHRDQKPIVFDLLSEKDKFAELKSTKTLELDVKTFVEKHLDGVKAKDAPDSTSTGASGTKQIEKLSEIKASLENTLSQIREVMETTNPMFSMTGGLGIKNNTAESFEWNAEPISKIQDRMAPASTSVNITLPPKPSTGAEKKKSDDVVEGFENIRNFAYF